MGATIASNVFSRFLPERAPQPTAAEPVAHFAFIDALRGLGVLGVLMVHASLNTKQTGVWGHIGKCGGGGVQLFYVASAFTLFLSANSRKHEARPTFNFFVRRFFRIAPAFYVAMFFTWRLARLQLFPHAADATHGDFLLGLFFLHGFNWHAINTVTGGAWSVADECLFYASLPLLYLAIRRFKVAVWAYAVALLLMSALSFWLASGDPAHRSFFLVFWLPIEVPVFLAGIATYLFWIEHRPRQWPHRRRTSLLMLLAAAGLFLVMNDHWFVATRGLASALALLALAVHPWPLLVNRFTRYAGKISYSVYLFHAFFMDFISYGLRVYGARHAGFLERRVHGHPSSFLLVMAVLLAVSLPFCTFTWKYLEEPFIRLGRRLIKASEQRQPTIDAAILRAS